MAKFGRSYLASGTRRFTTFNYSATWFAPCWLVYFLLYPSYRLRLYICRCSSIYQKSLQDKYFFRRVMFCFSKGRERNFLYIPSRYSFQTVTGPFSAGFSPPAFHRRCFRLQFFSARFFFNQSCPRWVLSPPVFSPLGLFHHCSLPISFPLSFLNMDIN